MTDIVNMTRDAKAFPESHHAIVHTDDVQTFKDLGWEVASEEVSLADMKLPDLKALAAERGVDLGDATKKADIIAALELAAEAASKAAEGEGE